jgi:transcriptional regulator with XRE-family HTH domain
MGLHHDSPAYREMMLALRRIREAQGISQAELTERIGLCDQMIAKYEVGMKRVSGPALALWMQGLGVRFAPVNEDAAWAKQAETKAIAKSES